MNKLTKKEKVELLQNFVEDFVNEFSVISGDKDSDDYEYFEKNDYVKRLCNSDAPEGFAYRNDEKQLYFVFGCFNDENFDDYCLYEEKEGDYPTIVCRIRESTIQKALESSLDRNKDILRIETKESLLEKVKTEIENQLDEKTNALVSCEYK